MAHILINKDGEISVFEYNPERAKSGCMCKYDIIKLPETIFSEEFLEKLKRSEDPIDLNELKNKNYEHFNQKIVSMG